MNTRRNFLISTSALGMALIVRPAYAVQEFVPVPDTSRVASDLISACFASIKRFSDEVEDFGDFLDIFQIEVTRKMKKWGTFIPYRKVPLVWIEEGVRKERPSGFIEDDNFTDSWVSVDGIHGQHYFYTKFKIPDGRVIYAKYHINERMFTLSEDNPLGAMMLRCGIDRMPHRDVMTMFIGRDLWN